MSAEDTDFWINNSRILQLADRLSQQTGENIDRAVLVALQERLERVDRIDSGFRHIVHPQSVAAARLIASSLRSWRIRHKIEELLPHPVTGEILNAIVESWEREPSVTELGFLPEEDQGLIDFCEVVESWARENCGNLCRLVLALVQEYIESGRIHVRRTTERTWRTSNAGLQRDILIPYESESFPNGCPCSSPDGMLHVTWDDILWAALTIGRPSLYHVFKHSKSAINEAVFRLSLVRMAIESGNADQHLHRTEAFDALDPTEKGAVTYFLGMVICKIFADKCLSTPWMLHVDVFGDQWKVQIDTGRSRPDLFGEQTSTNDWHVFESKGRSEPIRQADKANVKRQAQRVLSVNGVSPKLFIGACSYFKQNTLHFYWCDPTPNNFDKSSHIKLKLPVNAWSEHYRLVVEVMRAADLLTQFPEYPANLDAPLAEISELDVTVGVHPEVSRYLFDGDYDKVRTAASTLHTIADSLRSDSESMYRDDGLIVRSGKSWSEPQDGLYRTRS